MTHTTMRSHENSRTYYLTKTFVVMDIDPLTDPGDVGSWEPSMNSLHEIFPNGKLFHF